MIINTMKSQRVAVWGAGREGREAGRLLHEHALPFTYLDDKEEGDAVIDSAPVIRGEQAIADSLASFDIIVKSPGVSLYRDAIKTFKERGGHVTSLLNIWFAERTAKGDTAPIIAITGSKGKSTTATLLAQMLEKAGKKPLLVGNIGIPVSAAMAHEADILVLELSSYQLADFDGTVDAALVTSLYPVHMVWHNGERSYYADKLSLLSRAKACLAHKQVCTACAAFDEGQTLILPKDTRFFDFPNDETLSLIRSRNPYLARPHNLGNLAGVLALLVHLGLDTSKALEAAFTFTGLPHRQQEIGRMGDILCVNDSISTTAQSTIAALKVYQEDLSRPLTLIAGGYDSGLDYTPLADYIAAHPLAGVLCLGKSGARIHALLTERGITATVYAIASLQEAIERSKQIMPEGGTLLLSPAAPSMDMFRDFADRGETFAHLCGLSGPLEQAA